MLLVDDRDGEQVEAGNFSSHLLLILQSVRTDYLGLHNVRQPTQWLGQGGDQVACREDATQVVGFIDDVDVINGLHFRCELPQPIQGFADGQRFRQFDDLRRHDGTGRVFRIGLQTTCLPPLLHGELLNECLGQRFVDLTQFLKQVNAIVRRHIGQ